MEDFIGGIQLMAAEGLFAQEHSAVLRYSNREKKHRGYNTNICIPTERSSSKSHPQLANYMFITFYAALRPVEQSFFPSLEIETLAKRGDLCAGAMGPGKKLFLYPKKSAETYGERLLRRNAQ